MSLAVLGRPITGVRHVGRACCPVALRRMPAQPARLSSTTADASETPRSRRALLYVPGSDLKKLRKPTGADACIMDLEDSVAAHMKGAARSNVYDVLQVSKDRTNELFVRINNTRSGMAVDDLEIVLRSSRLDGIVIPKVESASDIAFVEEQIRLHCPAENQERLRIIASIESPKALLNLQTIATSSKRVDTLLFAAEDYCASSSLIRSPDRLEMLFARSSIVTVAKAFGLQAVDLVCVSYKDPKELERESREGRGLGFDGKQAIHPAQVDIIQQAYSPSEAEIDKAQQILSQYEEASKAGKGAYGLQVGDDTVMIDAPMLLQARAILSKARSAGLVK